MPQIVTTPLAKLLRKKNLLRDRLAYIHVPLNSVSRLFGRLNGPPSAPLQANLSKSDREKLRHYGLIKEVSVTGTAVQSNLTTRRKGILSLLGVRAINLELTYQCNMACRHCLQQNLRPSWGTTVLDLGMAKAAIHDAWFAGLLPCGVNLTGGEPLLVGETVFELIRYAHSLGLQVRLNTNSWWGTRGEHLIGGQRFSTPEHLVGHLKDLGLTFFALSCDARLEQDARAFDGLAGAIRACDTQSMPYQVVCTGCSSDRLLDLFRRLQAATGRDLRQLAPIRMEMVDMGGAAPQDPEPFPADTNLAQKILRSECAGRGFYHPWLVHVDPAGGVRTCLCASGLQNMGHLSHQSLIEIINDFPDNPVSRAFSAGQLEEVAAAFFVPAVWRHFRHPCTASAVLAGLIAAAARLSDENAHSAGHERLRSINEQLACAMNLVCHQS